MPHGGSTWWFGWNLSRLSFGQEDGANMDESKTEMPGRTVFPRVDRSVIVVGDALGQSDDKAYWLSRTPLERLEAVQLLREMAFGYDAATARLQRVLEIAEFPAPDTKT